MSPRLRRIAILLIAATLSIATGQALADDPGTSIDGGPSGTTSDTTPTFEFSSSEDGSTFECRIDRPGRPAEFRPCDSPYTVELSDGDYTFVVRAIDAAGNADATPATRSFAIDTGAADTFISAGPDGATNDPTPSFTFGSSATGATFECRIDGPGTPVPAFAACSSPFTTPLLKSGSYTLAVRALDTSGRPDRSPATRAFTIDADPPDTQITDGPADGGDTPTRTPSFAYASEDGATYECRIDNTVQQNVDTVPWSPCPPKGFTTRELEGGEHLFEVRATDAAGNPDPTPAARTFRVSVCEREVSFKLVQVRAACLKNVGTRDRPRWESEDDAKLNGIPLPAPGPSKVVVQEPTEQSPGGKVSVSGITLKVGSLELYRGELNWDLPAGNAGEEKDVPTAKLSGSGDQLFGLKAKGEVQLRLGRRTPEQANGGPEFYSVLKVTLEMPELFKAGTSPDAKPVTGQVAVRVDQNGVKADGARIELKDAYIGKLGVKSACVSYVASGGTAVAPCKPPSIGGSDKPFIECESNSGQDRWDGSAVIVLPTASNTELGAWAGLSGGRLSYAGAYAGNLGTTVPLAPGVFLDQVALGVCVDPPPFKIKGQAGVAFSGAKLNAYLQYTDAYNGNPWAIEAGGELYMLDQRIASAMLRYQGNGLIDFNAEAAIRFGPASIEGHVTGWVETRGSTTGAASAAGLSPAAARQRERDPEPPPRSTPPPRGGSGGSSGAPAQPASPPPPPPASSAPGRFNVQGNVKVCVDALACAQADAVVSSIGAAGCLNVTVASVPWLQWVGPAPWDFKWVTVPINVTGGAGYTWATRKVDVMAGVCSLNNWVQQRNAVKAAGADGPGTTIKVADGQPVFGLRAVGEGAAPKLVITGPDGRRIASPESGGGSFVKDDHLLAEDEATKTTSVTVARPAAGEWHVEAALGSAPVVRVDQAAYSPPAAIGGHVSGRGYQRKFTYAYTPRPGQRIAFVERGPASEQNLGSVRTYPCPDEYRGRSGGQDVLCGGIGFRPADGPAGPRDIYAVIEEDGLPRETRKVTSYLAPPPQRPARPRSLRVRRRGTTLRITWRDDQVSRTYNIVVTTSDGQRRLITRPFRTQRATLRGVARDDRAVVEVRGMKLDGTEGKPAVKRLKPVKTKRRKRGRR